MPVPQPTAPPPTTNAVDILEFVDEWSGLFGLNPEYHEPCDRALMVVALGELVTLVGIETTADLTTASVERWVKSMRSRFPFEIAVESVVRPINFTCQYALIQGYLATNPVDLWLKLNPLPETPSSAGPNDIPRGEDVPEGQPSGASPELGKGIRRAEKPIQKADSLRALMEAQGCSVRALARELGVSHSSVADSLTLLKLPAGIRDLVERGKLAVSTALAIVRHPDAAKRSELFARAAGARLRRVDVAAALGHAPPKSRGRRRQASADGGGPRRQPSPGEPASTCECPVFLQGQGMPVLVQARGPDDLLQWVCSEPPSPEVYHALGLMVAHWPLRVSKSSFPGKGPGSGWRKSLRGLAKKPVWEDVLDRADRPRRGYGLVTPKSTNDHYRTTNDHSNLPSGPRILTFSDGTLASAKPAGMADMAAK